MSENEGKMCECGHTAAQAEVEAGRLRLQEREDVYDRLSQEMVKQSAELEQTRRVRDSLGVGYDEMHDELYSALGMHLTCAAEIDALRQALTAAEQRADGAEKERAKLGDVLEKWFPDITSPHAFPIERAIYLLRLHKLAKGDIAALTAQRDTAIRERDEAVARVRFLESIQANPSDIPETAELKADLRAALAAKTTEGGV